MPYNPSYYCHQCQGQGVITCPACNGAGRCSGFYIHTSFFGGRSTQYCQNGKCPRCYGKGSDGAIVFSDRCPLCGGSRVCPTCQGTGKCLSCNGAGKITCPSCGRSGL